MDFLSSDLFQEPTLPKDVRAEMECLWESGSPEEKRLLLLSRQAAKLAQCWSKAAADPAFSVKGLASALAFTHMFFDSRIAEDPTWFLVFDIGRDEAAIAGRDDAAKSREEIESALSFAEDSGVEIDPLLVAYLIHIWLGHATAGSREKSPHWTREAFALRADPRTTNSSEEWSKAIIARAFQENFPFWKKSGWTQKSGGCAVLIATVGLSTLLLSCVISLASQ